MTNQASGSRSAGWLPYVVAATFFLEYLDTTVIATALPQMARSFGIGPNNLSLGMTACMLALAIFIPASGWVADRCGSHNVFFGAIVTFTLASVLCGLSQNVAEFVTGSVTRIGTGAVPYLVPLLFQIGFGLSAFKSWLLLLASAPGNPGMKALTTRILQRWGFRLVSIVDVSIAAAATIACGLLTPDVPLVIALIVVFVYGLARSMQFSTLATLAYADIPQAQMSGASTLWSAAMQMTQGLGIAFGAVALHAAAVVNGEKSGHVFTLDDFRLAFLLAGIVTLIPVGGYMQMARDAGHNVGGGSGRQRAQSPGVYTATQAHAPAR